MCLRNPRLFSRELPGLRVSCSSLENFLSFCPEFHCSAQYCWVDFCSDLPQKQLHYNCGATSLGLVFNRQVVTGQGAIPCNSTECYESAEIHAWVFASLFGFKLLHPVLVKRLCSCWCTWVQHHVLLCEQVKL